MPTADISESATVVAAPDVLSSAFAKDTVMLNLADGVYYGLDQVGTRVWDLIRQPVTVGYLRDTLVSEYDVDPQRCERDLRALLGELVAKGLVRIAVA